MLIASPRHTARDLAHWATLLPGDARIARSPKLAQREDEAMRVLRRFAAGGPFFVGTSFGKDSLVVMHLAHRVGGIRAVWFPAGAIENPDCYLVRDVFLARFPMPYSEVEASDYEVHLWGHDGAQKAFQKASDAEGGRYASGVRAEESGVRKRRMEVFGYETTNTCAPIGWWSSEEVFAYLHKYDLPIHPAYACTMNGTLDRGRVRVGTIGGEGGTGWGRREWERRYYPSELRAVQALVASREARK